MDVPKRARRLQQIADDINRRYPKLVAAIEKGFDSTDRRIPGTRLIHKGKGRWGNRLIVRWRGLSTLDPASKVLDHNAAEYGRSNAEVEEWLRREAPRLVPPIRCLSDLGPKQREILTTAAGHPEGMAHVGSSTAARGLELMGLVRFVGRQDVQITARGEALVQGAGS